MDTGNARTVLNFITLTAYPAKITKIISSVILKINLGFVQGVRLKFEKKKFFQFHQIIMSCFHCSNQFLSHLTAIVNISPGL